MYCFPYNLFKHSYFLLKFSTDVDEGSCGECDHLNQFCQQHEGKLKCSNSYVIDQSDYGTDGGQFSNFKNFD